MRTDAVAHQAVHHPVVGAWTGYLGETDPAPALDELGRHGELGDEAPLSRGLAGRPRQSMMTIRFPRPGAAHAHPESNPRALARSAPASILHLLPEHDQLKLKRVRVEVVCLDLPECARAVEAHRTP